MYSVLMVTCGYMKTSRPLTFGIPLLPKLHWSVTASIANGAYQYDPIYMYSFLGETTLLIVKVPNVYSQQQKCTIESVGC